MHAEDGEGGRSGIHAVHRYPLLVLSDLLGLVVNRAIFDQALFFREEYGTLAVVAQPLT